MFKKSCFIAAVGIVSFGIINMTYAAFFTGWGKMIMMPVARQHIDYRYPYIKVGVGAYYVQNPKFEVGTLGNDTAPLAEIGTSKVTPRYNVSLGYAFYNPGNSWVTRVFGHDNAVELRFHYLNLSQKKYNGNLGTGRIWFIDGSGEVTTGAQPLTNFNLRASHRYIDTGLYYRGKWITGNPNVNFSPRAGAVFTNLKEKYNYTLVYQAGLSTTDLENYKVNTNYYGLAAGCKLAYKVQRQFAVFGDIEAQLLYANSALKAYQDAAVGSNADKMNVNYHHAKITYRAIAAIGGTYKLNSKAASPSVELKGGVDRWGFDPRVVPPNHAGDRAVYIAGNHQNNLFADVNVTVPIG